MPSTATLHYRHYAHAADCFLHEVGMPVADCGCEPCRSARVLADDVTSDAGCRAALGRAAGTADPLGLDPTDRLRSWSGRYDGAE